MSIRYFEERLNIITLSAKLQPAPEIGLAYDWEGQPSWIHFELPHGGIILKNIYFVRQPVYVQLTKPLDRAKIVEMSHNSIWEQ